VARIPLVGTTDTDFDGDLDRLHATRDEVSYLLGEVRRALPDPRVAFERVVYTYAGVRRSRTRRASASRRLARHKVVTEAAGAFCRSRTKHPASGASRPGSAMPSCAPSRPGAARTDGSRSTGSTEEAGRVEARTWLDVSARGRELGARPETLETLVTLYGAPIARRRPRGKVPSGTDQLCPQTPDSSRSSTRVQDELAVSLQDVLLRRTGSATSLSGDGLRGSRWTPDEPAARWSPGVLDAERSASTPRRASRSSRRVARLACG